MMQYDLGPVMTVTSEHICYSTLDVEVPVILTLTSNVTPLVTPIYLEWYVRPVHMNLREDGIYVCS